MIELIRSATFDRWLSGLRDRRAVARIGASGPAGDGASRRCRAGRQRHLRASINHGPGCRVHCLQRGPVLVLLLCGDKSSQGRDIRQAKALAAEWKD